MDKAPYLADSWPSTELQPTGASQSAVRSTKRPATDWIGSRFGLGACSDEVAPISPLSFRDGSKSRARNLYSQPVVMDSGLAPLARPGMTRSRSHETIAVAQCRVLPAASRAVRRRHA